MRIGILTLPFNNNYGGYLQAYALMTVLKQMGHQPTLIMRRHDKPVGSIEYKLKLGIKGLIKTILTFKKHQIFYDVEYSFKTNGKEMLKFVNEYIQPQTPYLYDTNSLQEYCKGKFEAYIVGSDQVWRAIYVPDIKNYFLNFTEGWDVRRISYAASFGTDRPEYTDDQIDSCRELLSHFDAVSVREQSGIEVFKKFDWIVKSVQYVLDPTMLLSAKDYSKKIPVKKAKSADKIFYYVLDRDEKIDEALSKASSLLEKELYGISNIQKVNGILPSIEEWLTNIRDAEFVVTDSFHGMVFSIIFQKPFVVCVNKDRGSERFVSLLKEFGLENRILTKEQPIDSIIKNSIDWNSVNSIIDKEKEKSLLYLRENLK